MRVLVLGGGVIGISTAYYLSRLGVSVTLVERQSGPAQETSYGNAGQVSPGYSTPWAAPGIPLKALKWMFQRHAPLAIRPDWTLDQLRWMGAMLSNCSPARYAVNKERMLRLAEYSRDCLRALRQDTGIQYEQRTGGTLQLFRDEAQMQAARRDIAVLEENRVPYELLTAADLHRVEPALAGAASRLAGGLRLPNDETGDCRLFTVRLAEIAARQGVRFRYDAEIRAIEARDGRIVSVQVGTETLDADRYVVALGSHSPRLLKPLGLRLPVYPVKGYSLTIPITDAGKAPVSTVLDETYKVAVTRFDDRIRVGGMAELGGFDLRLNPRRRETLELVVNDLYPGSGDVAHAEFWTGLRPMTPDSTPVVGATPFHNLFLNTGHGTLGWTMSCGSGKLLADLITGRPPEISLAGLDISRYGVDRHAPAAEALA